MPLYISILYKIMKAEGTHEGTAEQIARLFRDHLAPGRAPRLDDGGRIRVDDLEMEPATQREVSALWNQVTTENLFSLTDYAGFKQEFRSLFGFEVPGRRLRRKPVETDVPLGWADGSSASHPLPRQRIACESQRPPALRTGTQADVAVEVDGEVGEAELRVRDGQQGDASA